MERGEFIGSSSSPEDSGEASSRLLAGLTQHERDQATERYRVIRPFLEEGIPLAQIAMHRQETARTLRRWVHNYRRGGLAGLARKERTDAGKHRRLSDEARQLVEGLALQKPPLTAASIYRQISTWLQDKGEQPPSYDVVHEVIRSLPTSLITLAHDGEKAYAQRFDLIHRREADAPNAIWQADHCLLDIWLAREGQEPARPWLTVVEDDYSRAIAGYFLTFDAPSTLSTSLALRQAIWRKEDSSWHLCGIPTVFYSDNGSDFTSHHLEQVSIDLKMRLVFSIPGKPRGRGKIERFFDTLNQLLLCELPGYSPPNGATRGEPALTLPDLDRRFREFLLGTYHRREHGDTRMPPQERWDKGGFLPQMPESLEQLDLLLLTVPKSRRIRPDGIHFLSMRYIDPTLAAYVGEDVILRYDPRDIAEVRVFYQDRFLCRAICQELAGETVPLKEILRARNHHRKQLRRTIQDRQRTVDTLLELRRWSPQNEDLSPPAAEAEPKSPPLKRYYNE